MLSHGWNVEGGPEQLNPRNPSRALTKGLLDPLRSSGLEKHISILTI